MTYRSYNENKDLAITVRVNGRVAGAFTRLGWANDFAYAVKEDFPDASVQVEDPYGTILKLGPTEKLKECT